MPNAIFYASFIPDHSPHRDLLKAQTPTRLSKKAEHELENTELLEKENLGRSRDAETRPKTGKLPGSSDDKLTWSRRQRVRPGPLGAWPWVVGPRLRHQPCLLTDLPLLCQHPVRVLMGHARPGGLQQKPQGGPYPEGEVTGGCCGTPSRPAGFRCQVLG